jgi:tRNA (adenine22-N1)-methyltransferase
MKISSRILKIAGFINRTDRLIDVGGDHSYLSIYCVRTGIAKRALVTDIKEGPLNRAGKNICLSGLDGLIDTKKTDGLEDVQIGTGDSIVISGMGTEVIIDILEHAKERFFSCNDIVLQPANAPQILKMYLFSNGFEVICDSCFMYRKLPYVILKCRKTGKTTDIEDIYDIRLFVPSHIERIEKEPLLSYLERVLKRQKNILEGYDLTGDPHIKRQENLVRELEELHESVKANLLSTT